MKPAFWAVLVFALLGWPVDWAVGWPVDWAVGWTAGPGTARAGEADVVAVEAVSEGSGSWRFHVSVVHGDTGWDHYADKWDVVAPDGAVLGTRVLLHPHEAEQPFTRSLGGVQIPAGVAEVTLRAHDSEHGYGGKELTVEVAK